MKDEGSNDILFNSGEWTLVEIDATAFATGYKGTNDWNSFGLIYSPVNAELRISAIWATKTVTE